MIKLRHKATFHPVPSKESPVPCYNLSHTYYQSPAELIERVHFFEQDINSRPFEICVGVARRRHRLWVKNHLEEDEEKLRVSR